MGRYKGHITHSFSNDPTRPTFEETMLKLRVTYLQWELDKLQPEEQRYALKKLIEEGLVIEEN